MDKNSPANKALITTRIIWFALLMGQIAFMVVVAVMDRPKQEMAIPLEDMVGVNFLILLTVVPVAFFIRRLIFRRGEVDGAAADAAYQTGNIIFWASCEMVSFFGLITVFISGSWWPAVVPTVIALGLQAMTFPVGGRT
jgi:hypothetical protein